MTTFVYGGSTLSLAREVRSQWHSCELANDLTNPPKLWPKPSHFVVAIGDGRMREEMTNRAQECGHHLQKFSAINLHESIPLRDGTLILRGCLLTCDITIGRGVLINLGVMIGHDCVIEDYASIQPHANLSGCRVGRYAYIGMAATIVAAKPGEPMRSIGEGAIIGAGAVVTHDVPAGECWVGNPARRIR